MTKEQQYWEDTQEALSRIFDQCEEIDAQSGYDMLEDIQFVRGFINKHMPQEESKEVVELPFSIQQRRVGRWIRHITNDYSQEERVGSIVYRCDSVEKIECDQCRCWFLGEHLVRRSYCPNCGSKMEVEE